MPPRSLASEVHAGIVAEVEKWKEDIRDWRKLSCDATAEQWKELHASAAAPKTPRLYATHLRLGAPEAELRQRRLEGLLQAVALGNLQACEEGQYWVPSFGPGGSSRSVHAPLSRALTPCASAPPAPCAGELQVAHDQDALEICRAAALRGERVALVHWGAPKATPLRELRESQLHLRTTYLHALQEMPRQMHRDPQQALQEGRILHTAHVSILRGPVEEGACWLDAVEIEVLAAALQRSPRSDMHEQYARIQEKAAAAKTVDDILSCAASWGIEVLVMPPFVNGAGGCYHPPADAGQLLRHAVQTRGCGMRVVLARQLLAPLAGWASFADAALNGRAAVKREPPIPMHLSPYNACYLGKKPDFTTFTLPKLRRPKGPQE